MYLVLDFSGAAGQQSSMAQAGETFLHFDDIMAIPTIYNY